MTPMRAAQFSVNGRVIGYQYNADGYHFCQSIWKVSDSENYFLQTGTHGGLEFFHYANGQNTLIRGFVSCDNSTALKMRFASLMPQPVVAGENNWAVTAFVQFRDIPSNRIVHVIPQINAWSVGYARVEWNTWGGRNHIWITSDYNQDVYLNIAVFYY